MQKRFIILISIVIICILVGGVVAAIVFFNRSSSPEGSGNNQHTAADTNTSSGTLPSTNTTPTPTGEETPTPEEETTQTDNDEESVVRLARIVVERYGSFSNTSNYENITRLEPFMTEQFQQTSLAYIESQSNNASVDEFYGVSTRAVSFSLEQFVPQESATVRVSTQRVETRTGQEVRTFTQDALVYLLNVEGNWKVDNIVWQ